MRTSGILAGCIVVALLLAVVSEAQAPRRISDLDLEPGVPAPAEIDSAPAAAPTAGLLSVADGRAILLAAWRHRSTARRDIDCSNLVHEVYRLAGVEFPYAPSDALYQGIAGFERVRRPQPGDLVVWRGHVGIVVTPEERSFYSSLNSGLRIDRWDTRYWRSRGTPRFYRYRLSAEQTRPSLLLASAPAPTLLADVPVADNTLAAESRPAAPACSAGRMLVGPEPEAPAVQRALLAHAGATAELLAQQNGSAFAAPLLVFDELRVQRIRVKDQQGWAEVRLRSLAQVSNGRAEVKKKGRKHRLPLAQSDAGWCLSSSPEGVYIARDQAVRLFSERLAALSRSATPDRGQQAALAKLLHELLRR